ncbi:hypothetical protein QP794_07595 [Paenibacillus sp. UMB7766-LJ446]|uniref:hypothetical protein n=1 Tax=Paenibacillus sp. UMB7766-LJ446 TaxID=3046313 RepID=UPI00254F3F2B|nr:hypothetical protein [Paenibacillus sp. UMB7766-LJ446]MDK8189945.1 hypothetical protein [Paenibacillus sp. UMB7766-LJ446]
MNVLIFVCVVLIMGCCSFVSVSRENTQAINKAIEAGETHFKEKYNLNVEFTRHKLNPPDLGTDVGLYGHFTEDKDTEVFLLINYETL